MFWYPVRRASLKHFLWISSNLFLINFSYPYNNALTNICLHGSLPCWDDSREYIWTKLRKFKITSVLSFSVSVSYRTERCLTLLAPKISNYICRLPFFFLTNCRLERSLFVKLKDWMSNSVDPDETAHYELSHLDLRCLQRPIFIAYGSERVNKTTCNIQFGCDLQVAAPPSLLLADIDVSYILW